MIIYIHFYFCDIGTSFVSAKRCSLHSGLEGGGGCLRGMILQRNTKNLDIDKPKYFSLSVRNGELYKTDNQQNQCCCRRCL